MGFSGAFWDGVHAWAPANDLPATVFAPGASPVRLRHLDEALPTGCPPLLAELLEQHDGAGAGWPFFDGGNMLSCDDILAERSLRGREARVMGADTGRPRCDGPVRALWWSDAWIPFLKRNKEPVCVDLDPASAGTVGQVIEVDWEGRSNRVLAPSLEAYLGGVLRGLRAL